MEKEFYLHPSSKRHFYDKLRGRRLAESLKSHTVLSPFQSALYKIQASVQTEEMREQDEHSVSLLCIFLEDDTKHCFFELLIFYFIIHRYTNRSLNAWLAQNFSKSNTKWEHPALDEMDTPQKAKQDKVGLLHWVVGEAFGICNAQKTAAKEDGNNWGTGTVFRDTTFLLFWKGEVLKTDSPLYLRAPTLNTQISLASEMRFCPFLFLEEVTEICCLYRETTKANFSA